MKYLIFFLNTIYISKIICNKEVFFNFNLSNTSNLIFTNVTIDNIIYNFLIDTSTDYLILFNNSIKKNKISSNLYNNKSLSKLEINNKYKIEINKDSPKKSNISIAHINIREFYYYIGIPTTYTEEIKLLNINGIIGLGVDNDLIYKIKDNYLSNIYFSIEYEDNPLYKKTKGIVHFGKKISFSKSSSVNFNIYNNIKWESISKSLFLGDYNKNKKINTITQENYLILDTSLDKIILPEENFHRLFDDILINNKDFDCSICDETGHKNYTIRCKKFEINKFPHNLYIELKQHYLIFPFYELFILKNSNNTFSDDEQFCNNKFNEIEYFEFNVMTYNDCNEIRLGQSFLKNFFINFLDDNIEIYSKDYIINLNSKKFDILLYLLVIAAINILILIIIYIILKKLNYFKRIKKSDEIREEINNENLGIIIDNNNIDSNDSFIQLSENQLKNNVVQLENINDSTLDNNNENISFSNKIDKKINHN